MTPERWRQVEELFHAAVNCGDEQRAALLRKAEADDPALRAEVDAMLAAHRAADAFGSESVVRTNDDLPPELDIEPDPYAICEGSQLGGYRLVTRLGHGGMGTVWLAEHIALQRRVALKVLHPELSVKADMVTRFFNEARAATAIVDPGIVQVFDFGKHVDGTAYIVMELLEGEALNLRLKREPLSLQEGMRLMRQVASTIGAAHARGIVHRDLKPANIYIVRDPEVPGGVRAKVLDFGIAKLMRDEPGFQTRTTAVIGTPSFMSPEQCRGAGRVDQRADVYSLGCVLFTLIAGRPPFVGEGAGDIIAMHLREPPPAPSTLCPTTPPEIDALVLRCLAKDRQQRFSDAGELAAAIDEILGVVSGGQIGRATGSSTVAHPTTLSGASAERLPSARRPRTRLIAAIAAAAALAVAVVVIAMFAVSGDRSIAPTPPAAKTTEPAPASVAVPAPEPMSTPPPAPEQAPAEPAPPSALERIPAPEPAPSAPAPSGPKLIDATRGTPRSIASPKPRIVAKSRTTEPAKPAISPAKEKSVLPTDQEGLPTTR